MKRNAGFARQLRRYYGVYTLTFALFVLLLAIGESMGLSQQVIGHVFLFVTIAIYATIGVMSRTSDVSEYYVAGRRVPAMFNGMATAADWMSAASFIGLAGTLYFSGFEGLAFVTGWTGGFVLVVVLLLLAGVLVAGKAQHWFDPMREIDLKFPPEGSMELQKGGEVMLLGAKVGSVQDILVDDDGRISGTIRVRGPFMRFVRADSIALVKKKMVVTGDAYIELTRGTGEALPRTGGEIECKKDTEILQMLEKALETLQMEAENTLRLVNTAIIEYTDIAENLNDPQGNLQQLLANVNGLLLDIRTGAGLPAKVLNDPAMAKDVENIVAQVQELMTKINAMAAELQATVAKLPPMADTLGAEVDNLPALTGDAQTMMRETSTLLDGLQKHWLLKKYMGSDDAVRSEEVLLP